MGRLVIEMIWTICSLKESLIVVISNRLSALQGALTVGCRLFAPHCTGSSLEGSSFISPASAH
jgi:hypothetical protein